MVTGMRVFKKDSPQMGRWGQPQGPSEGCACLELATPEAGKAGEHRERTAASCATGHVKVQWEIP